MKNLITICFLFLISLTLSAQNTKVSITGGSQFAVLNSVPSEIPNLIFAFSDSTGSFFRAGIIDVNHKYKSKVGYNLGIHLQKKISTKLSFETGLNFSYISFIQENKFGISRPIPNSSLTFFDNDNPNTNGSYD